MGRAVSLALVFAAALALPVTSGAVDGVVEINQACAEAGCFEGDEAGLPVTITNPGSYRLTSDIGTAASATALQSTVGPVSLDLNGFTILGAMSMTGSRNSLMRGSITAPVNSSITVGPDCAVQNMSIMLSVGGLFLGDLCVLRDSSVKCPKENFGSCVVMGSRSAAINNTIFDGFDARGLTVGDQSIIKDNRVLNTVGGIAGSHSLVIQGNVVRNYGVCFPTVKINGLTATHSVVRDNTVSAPCGSGIVCDSCTVLGNVVHGSLRGVALEDPSGTTGYAGNHFDNNNGGNANPQVSGGIEIGQNICGGDTTCP